MNGYGTILKIARLFYRFAAQRDYKDLLKINLSKLRETEEKPEDMEPRDFYKGLNELATEGPIFSKHTLLYIARLGEDYIPDGPDAPVGTTASRKQFIKWLANACERHKDAPSANDLLHIKDYLNGSEEPVNLDQFDHWNELYRAAQQWHEVQWGGEVTGKFGYYRTDDVVYSFSNGYKIVAVSDPQDLKVEGDMMQHCVGTNYCYYVEEGRGKIYSLRDPSNKPHVTIRTRVERSTWPIKELTELSGETYQPIETVEEIKGKQNEPPVAKYQEMIKEWLSESLSKDRYLQCGDYLKMADEGDVDDLLQLVSDRGLFDQDTISILNKTLEIINRENVKITSDTAEFFNRIVKEYLESLAELSEEGDPAYPSGFSEVKMILNMISFPFIKSEYASKIINVVFKWDVIEGEWGRRPSHARFKLMHDNFDDVPNIEAIRRGLIKYSLKSYPMEAVRRSEYDEELWRYVEPAVAKIMNRYTTDRDLAGYGKITTREVKDVLGYLPGEKRFHDSFVDGTFKYADDLTTLQIHDFERAFLFKGTKIGDRARPFAEVKLNEISRRRLIPGTGRGLDARIYFNEEYHEVKEIDDLTFKAAQELVFKFPAYFFKRNFDEDPRFKKLLNHARLRMFYKAHHAFPEHLVGKFWPPAHRINTDMDQREAFFDPKNYPSLDHYVIIIEKVLDHLYGKPVGDHWKSMGDQIKNEALKRIDQIEERNETRSST